MDDTSGGPAPDTLLSSINLGYAHLVAGRVDEAIPLFERILADDQRLRGETQYTMRSRGNLAAAYEKASRFAEAAPDQSPP
jgi:tetratricopeptide (TPR) repeat protein